MRQCAPHPDLLSHPSIDIENDSPHIEGLKFLDDPEITLVIKCAEVIAEGSYNIHFHGCVFPISRRGIKFAWIWKRDMFCERTHNNTCIYLNARKMALIEKPKVRIRCLISYICHILSVIITYGYESNNSCDHIYDVYAQLVRAYDGVLEQTRFVI